MTRSIAFDLHLFEDIADRKSEGTHVYTVKVRLGSGTWRWLYSKPMSDMDAEREAHELRATGHRVLVMTTAAAAARQKRQDRREKATRARG